MSACDAERPRFGQLTYTSFDRPGTAAAGGWQVKDITGDLDADEKERLRAGIVTRFDAVPPIPRFPNAEELRNRPRRLMYAPGAGRTGMYWHTVPAGADASGRPGNVFAHCLIDRVGDKATGGRPIERWGSSGWFVPYGADEVAAATLGATEPEPSDLVSCDAVLDFLLDPDTWRVGVFSVLLDAVARALEGGPPVVLGCRDPHRAALWIASVSHFMSPGTSGRFGWSTFDRLHAVDDAVACGAHLIAVPLDDLPGDTPGCVVFGEDESPDLGELDGEPHCVDNGDLVSVTPWSLLAQTVLVEEDPARRALARQDAIASEVGDDGLSPMWPLAMAVVSNDELHDALDEATTILLEHSPETVAGTEWAALIANLVEHNLGDSTEDAARALDRWSRDDTLAPAVRILAAVVFAHRAFDDVGWIASADPRHRELFDHCDRAPELVTAAERAIDRLRQRVGVGSDRIDVAVDALRTIDVVVRAGLLTARSEDRVFEILELAVVPVLCDSKAGPAVVAEVGEVGETTCVDFVQPAVVTYPDFLARPLGRRLERSVFAWVACSLRERPTFEELVTDRSVVTSPVSVLVAEGVFGLTADGGRVRSDLATVASWRAFFELDDGAARVDSLDEVVAAQKWSAVQWCQAIETFPQVVAPRYLQDAVVCNAWATDVEAVAAHLIRVRRGELRGRWHGHRYFDALAESWAAIRWQESWSTVGGPEFDRAWQQDGLPVLTDYARQYAADLPSDVLARLVVFLLGALARPHGDPLAELDLPAAHQDALVDAVVTEARYAVESIVELVESGVIGIEWLLAHAVFSSPRAPRAGGLSAQTELLSRLVIESDGGRQGLLDEVVTRLLPASWFRGPGAVMTTIHAELRARGRRDADRVCEAYEAFVVWWFDQRLADAERVISGPRGSI